MLDVDVGMDWQSGMWNAHWLICLDVGYGLNNCEVNWLSELLDLDLIIGMLLLLLSLLEF